MNQPMTPRYSSALVLSCVALALGVLAVFLVGGERAYGEEEKKAEAQDKEAKQQNKAKPKKLAGEQKTIYELGVSVGQGLKQFDLTDAELKLVIRGLTDAVRDEAPAVDTKQYEAALLKLLNKRMAASEKNAKADGATRLKKEAAKPGAVKTKSGLVYFETKAGKGASPKPADTVSVHYTITLVDGTVVDSSVDRGKPMAFKVNQVIAGWVEGLQMMKVGGKARLVIPAELGYGLRGAPPKIPGDAVLIAEIELLSINQ